MIKPANSQREKAKWAKSIEKDIQSHKNNLISYKIKEIEIKLGMGYNFTVNRLGKFIKCENSKCR